MLKISVILPVKDCNIKSLKTCLKSIILQSYQNWEVIVKCNVPTQAFDQIRAIYSGESRIKYLNQPDKSITDAANQALQITTGYIITVFAHDDVYYPDTFQTLINNVDESMWYCGEIDYYVDDDKKTILFYKDPTLDEMEVMNQVLQPACFWKREVHQKIGPFNDEFRLCWDYDFWIRLLKLWKPKCLDFCMARYNLSDSSISRTQKERMEIEVSMVREKHFPEGDSSNSSDSNDLSEDLEANIDRNVLFMLNGLNPNTSNKDIIFYQISGNQKNTS